MAGLPGRETARLREDMARGLRTPVAFDRAVAEGVSMKFHRVDEPGFARGAICDDPCSRDRCCKCVNTPEANQTPYVGLDLAPTPVDPTKPMGLHQEIFDPVDHPAHYMVGGIETIDFIEAKGLNLHEGSIVQYITRWRYKGGIEDLKKARWYIDRLISLVEKGAIA